MLDLRNLGVKVRVYHPKKQRKVIVMGKAHENVQESFVLANKKGGGHEAKKLHFHKDHKYHDPAVTDLPGFTGGMAEALELLRSLAPTDFKVTVLASYPDGKGVITSRVQYSGTHTGTVGQLKATGKKVSFEAIIIDQCDEDSLIVETWVQADYLGALQQIGLVPIFKIS